MRKIVHLLLALIMMFMALTGCSMAKKVFQGGKVSLQYNSQKWTLTQQIEKTGTPILVLCKKDNTAMIAVQAFTSEKEVQSDAFFAAIKEMDQETGELKDETYDAVAEEEVVQDSMSYQCELKDGTSYSVHAKMQQAGEAPAYILSEAITYEETPETRREITQILQTIQFSDRADVKNLSDTPQEYRQLGVTLDDYVLMTR